MCDNKDIYGLLHETFFQNIESIFKDKKLETYLKLSIKNKEYFYGFLNPSDEIYNAYPGVYTAPIMKNTVKVLNSVYYPGNIQIILSKALLKRKACHINKVNEAGIINKATYKNCSENIDKFLKTSLRKKYNSRLLTPEIVFHRSIPVKYIEKIICPTKIVYDEVMKIKGIPKKLLIIGKLEDHIKEYTKNCDKKHEKNDTPNYCYYNTDKYRKRYNIVNAFKFLIKNPDEFIKNCKVEDSMKKKAHIEIKKAQKEIRGKDIDQLFELWSNPDTSFSKIIQWTTYAIEKNHI